MRGEKITAGQLPLRRHHLDKPPLPDAVRRSSDVGIDMDQLRPSLHGVAPTLCGRMDCACQARVAPGGVLGGALRMHRHRLQPLRAGSIDPRGRHAGAGAHAAHGEAPIPRRTCDLYDGHAGCARRTPPRLRSDMRRPDPPLAAGAPAAGGDAPRVRAGLHKSMTTSRIGCEQQTRRLPSAGFSSGSGP